MHPTLKGIFREKENAIMYNTVCIKNIRNPVWKILMEQVE